MNRAIEGVCFHLWFMASNIARKICNRIRIFWKDSKCNVSPTLYILNGNLHLHVIKVRWRLKHVGLTAVEASKHNVIEAWNQLNKNETMKAKLRGRSSSLFYKWCMRPVPGYQHTCTQKRRALSIITRNSSGDRIEPCRNSRRAAKIQSCVFQKKKCQYSVNDWARRAFLVNYMGTKSAARREHLCCAALILMMACTFCRQQRQSCSYHGAWFESHKFNTVSWAMA